MGDIAGILLTIMITVVIQGGLGNQLFQYAYGRALMAKGEKVVFDISFFDTNTKYTKRQYLLEKFNISKNITTTKEPKLQSLFVKILNKIDVDRKVRYVKHFIHDGAIFDGYYNSDRYFKDIRDIILKEVTLLDQTPLYKTWSQKIMSANNPVVVHARRSDYVNSGFVNLDESYYSNALSQFGDDVTIFAFSDDIKWLEETLKRPVVAVSNQGLFDYEELMLMTLAENFVIANSTFSWWGAWLSQAKNKKVVAPKGWFKSPFWYRASRDVVPKEWIRI